MNNTISNQKNGVEYSELYKRLHKEVSEQNVKTAQLPHSSLEDYLGKQTDDKAIFSNYNQYNQPKFLDAEIEKFKEDDVISAITGLVVAIKQNSSAAYESQNNLLANRIAALLKS
jgi:hypothetical protein